MLWEGDTKLVEINQRLLTSQIMDKIKIDF